MSGSSLSAMEDIARSRSRHPVVSPEWWDTTPYPESFVRPGREVYPSQWDEDVMNLSGISYPSFGLLA